MMDYEDMTHNLKVMFQVLILLACTVPICVSTGCSAFTDLFIEKDLTEIPLDQVLKNGKPTLVDFGWRDCEPCKKMKIVLGSLEYKYRGKLNFVIVEAYNHRDLMDRYKINAIPVQILFDGSEHELVRHAGFWPEEDIIVELIKAGIN
ncbi:MAG: thioredoxin fold domain-containing protein [Dehalococcoidia bacterium]|jgi:thiol-disulfide isomerase/thioredoxin